MNRLAYGLSAYEPLPAGCTFCPRAFAPMLLGQGVLPRRLTTLAWCGSSVGWTNFPSAGGEEVQPKLAALKSELATAKHAERA